MRFNSHCNTHGDVPISNKKNNVGTSCVRDGLQSIGHNMRQDNKLRFLAVDLIRNVGNKSPTKKQISLMESILSNITISHHIAFDKKLTHREIACLFWASQGKSADEIANILNISPQTVYSYQKEIKRKLSCTSMAHAVFLGIRYGHIHYKTEETLLP